MKNQTQSKLSGWLLQAAALAAVLFAPAMWALGVEAESQPSTRPAETVATKPYMPDNISRAAIELTYRQKAAISAVRDGPHWRETALYMMLARTAELVDPDASAKEFPALVSPAIGDLTDHPDMYRARKIRATLRVHQMREMVSGSKDWDATRDWPKDKKIWYMTGFRLSERGRNSDGKIPAQELVVFSLVDPTELLGTPDAVSEKGECTYGDGGKLIELAGVFYKHFKGEMTDSRAGERMYRDYPLVLAYYLKPADVSKIQPTGNPLKNLVIVVGIALIAVLFIVRKHAKRVRATPIGQGVPGGVKYTPLRNIEEDDLPDEERLDEPVDQDLVNAVKDFEDKRKTDGTDDKS